MSWSEKGKKYPIGLWLFTAQLFTFYVIVIIDKPHLVDGTVWLAGNFVIIALGSFLGFISFKTDIRCEYEPYRENLSDLLFNKRSWWLWLFTFQIINTLFFHDIGKPNMFTSLMMEIHQSIFPGKKQDPSIFEQISIANLLLCAIYALTAPLRRIQRIEKMLYNGGESYYEKENE